MVDFVEKVEVGEVFTISDEAGEENEVEVLVAFPVDGVEYVAVSFTEDLQEGTDEGIDIFFLKVDEEGDLAAIGSDEEFDKVSQAFDQIMEEEEGGE